jgi:hypothetical protein
MTLTVADIETRLEESIAQTAQPANADELLNLGEQILTHWVRARGLEPTQDKREGFRLLSLHRQGARGDPSFNACRETCRELVYHYNLVKMQPDHPQTGQRLRMMTLVANHLALFISGKMQTAQLGEFCCSSKPVQEKLDEELTTQ